MTGLCGHFDDVTIDIGSLISGLQYTMDERVQRYQGDGFEIGSVEHPLLVSKQPYEVGDGESLLWLWGEVYGYETENKYVSCPSGRTEIDSIELCGELYEKEGVEFVDKLNGEFAGVIYNEQENTVIIFTDRLGSRPLFWTPEADTLVFSSHIQSLVQEAIPDPELSPQYLAESLTYKRSFGVKTPIKDVERVPPATVLTIDLADNTTTQVRYWSPDFDPVDRPFSTVVDEFVEAFGAAMAERTADDVEYGIMLSGGSDSRLLVGGTDASCTGFHMADWRSHEAKVAEEVATTASCDFQFLHRDSEYLARALERNPAMSNFSGLFNQAHAAGFQDAISSKSDVCLAGQFADTLFKGYAVPKYSVSLGNLGSVEVPLQRTIESPTEYIDYFSKASPNFVVNVPEMSNIIEQNLSSTDNEVISHGISYSSISDLSIVDSVFPLTNQPDYFWHESLIHMMPYRNPFLDNRLIDLYLSIPVKYQLRRDIINKAVCEISPELGLIPHGTTRLPLSRHAITHYIAEQCNRLQWKFGFYFLIDEPPEHMDHLPWRRNDDVIRRESFLRDCLERRKPVVEATQYLDWGKIEECYSDHIDGTNNARELFMLATFLQMPLVEWMLMPDD